MARLWSRLFGSQPAIETAAPKPREADPKDSPQSDPVGFGTQVAPLDKGDRKNPMAVIQASLQTAQERSRAARYADFTAMDTGDLAAMIDNFVLAALTFDDVTSGSSFKYECDIPRAEEVLRLAIEKADLSQVAEEALRDMLKYGDCFGEPVFVQKQLTSVQMYPVEEITVNKDDKGRLLRGKDDDGFYAAFQQRRNGQVVAGWQPWEMVHGKLFPQTKLTYSAKGLLDDIRLTWKKVELVELGMVTARVTRAYPRRVHMLDMTGKDRADQERTLVSYINRMTNRVLGRRQTTTDNLPTAEVNEDLYVATGYITGDDGKAMPRLNEVRTEDPAIAGLAEMKDVEYLRAKQWTSVPSDVVGIRRNTTGDLDSQDLAYSRLLRRSQRQLEKFIRGILDQVLLSNGFLPSRTPYRIVFPVVTVGAAWKHSDARFRASMTLRNFAEMGMISRRFALKQAYNLSDREVDRIWGEIGDESVNPIFQLMIAPARNGQPTDPTSPAGAVSGAVGKAGTDGSPAAPTAAVVPATGAKAKASTTQSGISRGTDLGKALSGNNSG